jgi:hypothetical protein
MNFASDNAGACEPITGAMNQAFRQHSHHAYGQEFTARAKKVSRKYFGSIYYLHY